MRADGKTDYRARRRLTHVDKNKYQIPKYRLVVRLSNRYVTASIVFATLQGDKVLTTASSAELPRYGLKVGLKNYAAAYATGLLVARRTLQKLGLDETYQGVEEVTGEVHSSEAEDDSGKSRHYWVPAVDEERRPFRCYLDVGVRATTKGARLFGTLKGASDGGLDIPHNNKRFPGFTKGEGDEPDAYDAAVHRARIFGQHVAEYMAHLKEEDEESYKSLFSSYVEEGVEPDSLEALYESVHKAIREDPSPAPKKAYKVDKSFAKPARRTHAARRAAIDEKKARRIRELQALQGGDNDDVEDDE